MPNGALSPGEAELAHPSSTEIDFRRRWYEAHRERFLADEEGLRQVDSNYAGFDASAAEALDLLGALRRTGDLTGFMGAARKWAVKPETLDFNGHSGQMMLNQLAKHSDDPEQLARLLVESLSKPTTDRDAVAKIDTLVEYVKTIKVGSHPAPGHVPFLCSYFWGLADHQRWPVIWTSGASYIEYSTGESLPDDQAEKYGVFLERFRELTDDPVEFEKTASWWKMANPVFLDEVLAERAARGLDYDGVPKADRETNAKALVSTARYWGQQLVVCRGLY